MAGREDLGRLLKEAAAAMKRDPEGAVATLEEAYAIAVAGGVKDDVAVVSEDLARGWARRKSSARALHFARLAAKLAPEQRTSWTTLAKTCELIASRTPEETKGRRARALYRATAKGFKKASSLTKDREDKHWLIELASEAAEKARPPEGT